MAELSTKKRKSLRSTQFVFPSKRGFPIHDKAHATAAMRLCGQANPQKFGMSSNKALCDKVKQAVFKKFPEMK